MVHRAGTLSQHYHHQNQDYKEQMMLDVQINFTILQ